jgi:hypothetical protein
MGNTLIPLSRHGYVYVDTDSVQHILKHGYPSLRQQYMSDPIGVEPTLVRMFGDAYNQARETVEFTTYLNDCMPPTQYVNVPIGEYILAFLDWSDPTSNHRGSQGIYYLHAPVPNEGEVRKGIIEQRDNFIAGKTLLQLTLPEDTTPLWFAGFAPRTQEADVSAAHREQYQYTMRQWVDIWQQALDAHQGEHHVPWYAGIPHGFIVPPGGIVPPSNIRVVDGIEIIRSRVSLFEPWDIPSSELEKNQMTL